MEKYHRLNNTNMTSSFQTSVRYKFAFHIFYVISTFIIIVFGIIGNSICIKHITQKRVLRQTSAQYFGVFCIFDILVLMFYVVPEWITRGIFPLIRIDNLPLNSNPKLCQLYLFFTYWIRLVSVWTLAAYSVDRFMGLKNSKYRRLICGGHYNIKVIISVSVISLFVSLWKPYLSYSSKGIIQREQICATDSPNAFSNFVYDAIYACLLCIIPSILILIMNILIAVQLLSWQSNPTTENFSRHDLIGFQFAALLVLISSTFLFLSWPYFIVWIHSWWAYYDYEINPSARRVNEIIQIYVPQLMTRILFYLHFGINIILYTIASKYFKSQIKHAFTLKKLREQSNEYYNKT